MARTALYAPAHRVMGRPIPFAGALAQPPTVGPSADCAFAGVQDARLQWKAGFSTTVPEVMMWPDLAAYPQIDQVPSTAAAATIVAAAIPVSGTPMTLIPTTGGGITVGGGPAVTLSGLYQTTGAERWVDGPPVYRMFGQGRQLTGCYDGTTMLARALRVTSVGNDSSATVTITGLDMYGYLIHNTFTMANAGSVVSNKCFKAVISVVCNGTLSGSNVSVGQADVFALPFYCNALPNLEGFWNNSQHYNTGTLVNGVTTSPPTALTGDPRGTWAPPNASDGTKRWTLYMHPVLLAMLPTWTGASSYGINVGMFGQPSA
jgi:hypothetical protein